MLPGGAQRRHRGWRRLYLHSSEPGGRSLLQGRVVCAFRCVSIWGRRGRKYPALHFLHHILVPARVQYSVLCLLNLSHVSCLCPCFYLPHSQHGNIYLSPPQLRQLWRSRGSERMKSTEEEGLATTTTSTKRLAGAGPGRAGIKDRTGLLGLRARKDGKSAL